jgi:alkylation response protein AidB-like acyl-CoA dehydrogenase
MNFDFSDDQKLLADQVQRFLDERCPTSRVRQVLENPPRFAADVWQGLTELGLLGTAVPESYGGTGAGYAELCLVAQQIGRHIAPVPFGSTVYLLTEALSLFGSEEQKQQWLPKICAGEVKGALATTEALQQLTPEQVQCSVAGDQLSGEKLMVADGTIADLYLVLANCDNQLGLYLVPAGSAVQATSVDSVDLSRDVAHVVFSQASAQLLCADGWSALQTIYQRAAVLFAFEQLGGAQQALEMAVDYAKQRFAFGRAIGSFQAIKHMLADMFVAMKLAESNCYYAAWALANNTPELPLAAATARVGATEAFQLCARDNIQVHGGMGFTWEFDCHLYYRRANFLALEIGGLSEWEARLAQALPLQNIA